MTAAVLTRHGLTNADHIVTAAAAAGVPLWVAAALVEKESGGANVYGNDRGGVYSTTDPTRPDPNRVTRENYAAFEARVLAGETSNGVGPAQITWPGFIRDAKARGIRLWEPLANMTYGMGLLAGYLGGKTTDAAITDAGRRYNGALAYGQHLTQRAHVWRERLGADMARRRPTATDIRRLEANLSRRGFTIYCGPTYLAQCRANHRHASDSRHPHGLAIDVGKDPRPGTAVSDYERAHLDLLCIELDRDPEVDWRIRWRDTAAQGGGHHDHLHVDDRPDWWESKNLSGVLARDGVDIFIDPVAFPDHVPPTNEDGDFTLAEAVTAQDALASVGAYTGTRDGYLGPASRTAARAAQAMLGLTVDGRPGHLTRQAIAAHLAAPRPQPKPEPQPPEPTPEPEPEPEPPYVPSIPVVVLAGADHYETAALAADQAKTKYATGKVYLAASGTPDAVAAPADGRLVYARHQARTLPAATREWLERHDVRELVILGGDLSIPPVQRDAAIRAADHKESA